MAEKSFDEIQAAFPLSGQTMPALFIGHGSPMNAIEDNEFSRSWAEIGRRIPEPRAILSISAHWETRGTRVTAMASPETIHDFGGFPRELFEMEYPAPGSPMLAHLIKQMVTETGVGLDEGWGLDHGTWSVLCRMFPKARIPVVQLSLDRSREPLGHYQLGEALQSLRQRGILILGSGNIVHNLRMAFFQEEPFDWAVEFDEHIRRMIADRDYQGAIDYLKLGKAASLSVPTDEHYLPFLYILGLQGEDEQVRFFNETITMGSLSMRSFQIG